MTKRLNSAGFTIVELMIATLVFATILLLCTYGLLQISRTYYKGVTGARTQEAARGIIDDLSQSIQFGPGAVFAPAEAAYGAQGIYCAGGKRYTYVRDRQLVGNQHALVKDTPATCTSGTTAQNIGGPSPTLTADSRELLPRGMRLARFDIEPITGVADLYKITVRVVNGDTEVLNAAHDNCGSGRAGTQFCAMSELTTVVQKRVR